MNPLLLPELRELLAEEKYATLTETLSQMHSASVAEITAGLQVPEIWTLLACLPAETQGHIFSFYPGELQHALIEQGDQERVRQIVEVMSHDDRVDLLQQLEPEDVEQLLPLLNRTEREDIRRLLSFPEESVGSVMTTDYAHLPGDVSVEHALTLIRQQAPGAETIYYLYVVDENRRLQGIVSLRDLVLAEPGTLIRNLMESEVISVRADQDQEVAAAELAKYDFLAIPVVDDQHRLIGIVTFDDMADVLEEEMTEDFHLAAAVSPLEQGYSQTSAWALYERRVGWLVILVFVNLVSSGVIAAYEETLQAVIALAFFLPLLIDSGGNTGSQAATLIVRALATNEVKMHEWLRVLGKEFFVGLSLGGTMAVASFVLGWVRGGWEVGLIVGLSMLGIVLFTNLVGVLLPFLLTRLRFDPAVASSPLITTVADASGLLLYFSIATWVMKATGMTVE
jgi:magnesium transporter